MQNQSARQQPLLKELRTEAQQSFQRAATFITLIYKEASRLEQKRYQAGQKLVMERALRFLKANSHLKNVPFTNLVTYLQQEQGCALGMAQQQQQLSEGSAGYQLLNRSSLFDGLVRFGSEPPPTGSAVNTSSELLNTATRAKPSRLNLKGINLHERKKRLNQALYSQSKLRSLSYNEEVLAEVGGGSRCLQQRKRNTARLNSMRHPREEDRMREEDVRVHHIERAASLVPGSCEEDETVNEEFNQAVEEEEKQGEEQVEVEDQQDEEEQEEVEEEEEEQIVVRKLKKTKLI